ncbi:MAG: ABC transporter permease [Saccharofermentans sp.]|nr:ABC transporter permease [Saccharofermentans sp.]
MYLIDRLKKYIKETYINNKRAANKFVLTTPLIVLLAGIALTSVGVGRYLFLTNVRRDQNMASYWSGDSTTNYRQMSVFARGSRSAGETSVPLYIDAQHSLKRSDIIMIRQSLQDAADTGIASSGKGGLSADGRPQGWEDCFSSFLLGKISSLQETDGVYTPITTVDAQIVGVEGNFTALHPFAFEAGGFIPEIVDDLNVIVLNDNIAWRFFRSYDVIGRKIDIFGQNFTVIGVVSEPADSLAAKSGSEDFRVYVHFAALEVYANTAGVGTTDSTEGSTTTSNDVAILCYEAILPEIVQGVAKTDVTNALPQYSAANPQMYIVSNTGRFGVIDVWKYMWPIGKTEALLAGYEFPFWERAASLTISHLFADIIVTFTGIILLIISVTMFSLKSNKMSSKRNIRSSANTYNT